MADESLTDISTLDISKLKVPDLKKELKMRGLSTTGNKNELVERLQTSLKSTEAASADSIDDIEEDLLNDDDDEHLDANESVINEFDSVLEDDSPKTQKRKLSETSEPPETKNGPHKKVILNRKNSTSTTIPESKVAGDKLEDKSKDENDDKKVIKLSQLSAKERLEMRAKKFGVTAVSADAKKIVRAERFGSVSSNSASSINSSNVNTDIDVLKQRAARFGGSVSTVMSDLEKQQRLEKRKERFGGSTNANVTTLQSDKAKARLERFAIK